MGALSIERPAESVLGVLDLLETLFELIGILPRYATVEMFLPACGDIVHLSQNGLGLCLVQAEIQCQRE